MRCWSSDVTERGMKLIHPINNSIRQSRIVTDMQPSNEKGPDVQRWICCEEEKKTVEKKLSKKSSNVCFCYFQIKSFAMFDIEKKQKVDDGIYVFNKRFFLNKAKYIRGLEYKPIHVPGNKCIERFEITKKKTNYILSWPVNKIIKISTVCRKDWGIFSHYNGILNTKIWFTHRGIFVCLFI